MIDLPMNNKYDKPSLSPPMLHADFNDMKISTQTIIGISNITIDTEQIFRKLEVTPYTIIEKRRGRKRKSEVEQIPVILDNGSIITLKFGETIRGVDAKRRKKQGKFFRNAVTVVMFMDKKTINFKITKNGRFQFTGCKDVSYAINCIKYIWKQIYDVDTMYTINDNSDNFNIRFLTVMANIDFNIGFPINREKLDVFVNSNTCYNSLLETSFGYTGVNIKIKVIDPKDFYIQCMMYDKEFGTWIMTKILYSNFVNIDVQYQKYKTKQRSNTFLVFHSGNIIMSGFNPIYMSESYKEFTNLLLMNRTIIEEKL